ncbi:hypothetical protein TanjilG_23180 [Lupinus angustifolius]|uniref:Conglutin delta 2 n=1 Tax=Lupinus angustifolius TaxID=3871 RepID=COND2_LUPAN|nr:conglutin delta 2 precursor [Lupinus angustifolius]Q99235.1 RecName: Full=Conglutin delta 2; AltName: Allergen=Lup an delta-conglutin; Contains: RecName: Full=Conglutin delta-2 large chain; Contains: RecName: Full=Conglutin delta-2 small chain; Flags: Precursor [Lupinus angustifolius]AEB33722.1 conglutin delta 2 [Lupinus angustifolius]OIW20800.1 hypothetical protein TanjilG_23180 [Lupinus angustifolius]CAA37598.1 conglutin delta [Lupinus angustifolius]
MAKLTILIALVAALVLVVHTSAFQSSKQSCKRQLQQVNLRHCENHIAQRIQQQQEEEEDHALKLRGIKHVILRHRSSQEYSEESEELDQCCEQLNELNSQRCQCRALQQIYESQSEQCEGSQQEQQLEQELEKLPRTCGFGPLRRCDVNPDEE